MVKEKKLKICPNCGKILEAKDFLSNYFYMGGLDSVIERFTCGICNYRGLPILIREEDYSKVEFPNNRF